VNNEEKTEHQTRLRHDLLSPYGRRSVFAKPLHDKPLKTVRFYEPAI
jgi:hypothetical protein